MIVESNIFDEYTNKPELAIHLQNFTNVDDIKVFQSALIFAIQQFANNDNYCGACEELYYLAELLENTLTIHKDIKIY